MILERNWFIKIEADEVDFAILRSMKFEGTESVVRQNINSNDFHIRLGVPKNASQDEIKMAYRNLAREYHPDIGGEQEDFKRLQEAYTALKDNPSAVTSRATSGSKTDSAHEKDKNESHSWQSGSQEKCKSEKATKMRTNPDNTELQWIDRLNGQDLNRYRMLNRLAREEGQEEPYPAANEETFEEYYIRRKAELEEELANAKRARSSTGSPQGDFSSRQRTRPEFHSNARSSQRSNRFRQPFEDRGESLTGSLSKKQNSLGDWYMVDRGGTRVGRSYKSLRTLGRYIIGTNSINSETLIDPETGNELTRQYDKIRHEGPHIIGVNSINNEILLDQQTGSELSRQYDRIRTEGRYLVGVTSINSEILVDPNSGEELSRQYETVRFSGTGYEGITSIGTRESINLR